LKYFDIILSQYSHDSIRKSINNLTRFDMNVRPFFTLCILYRVFDLFLYLIIFFHQYLVDNNKQTNIDNEYNEV